MKRIIFVVFLLLSSTGRADDFGSALQTLESKWADIYYNDQMIDKEAAYGPLLDEATELSKKHPESAEFYFWRAVVMASKAEHQDGISALIAINQVRDLLLKAISIDQTAMNGSALATLGALHYLTPGWPISFGDKQKAENYLKAALRINPDGIDTNYYYGDFLARENKPEKAAEFFDKALTAPIRKEQAYADNRLKEEVRVTYNKLKIQANNHSKHIVASYHHNTNPKASR